LESLLALSSKGFLDSIVVRETDDKFAEDDKL